MFNVQCSLLGVLDIRCCHQIMNKCFSSSFIGSVMLKFIITLAFVYITYHIVPSIYKTGNTWLLLTEVTAAKMTRTELLSDLLKGGRRASSYKELQGLWSPLEVFRNFRKIGLTYNNSNNTNGNSNNIWVKLRFIYFISSGEDRAMNSRLTIFSGLSFFWALQLGWEEKVVLIFKDEFRFRFTINFKTCKQLHTWYLSFLVRYRII